MKSRSPQSIASVLATLESIQSPRQVSEVKIGNQDFHVVGDQVVRRNADGTFNLPALPADIIKAIAHELKIDLNSDINTNSTTGNGVTILIEAVLTNQHDVVTILLNHGADPSVCDEDGNNAFIHASKKGDSSILKEFLTLIKTQDPAKQPAVIEEKIEAETAPRKELNTYEQSQPLAAPVAHTTSQPAATSERVSLHPEILKHTNKAGETALKAIEEYKLSNPPKSVNAADAAQKKSSKPSPRQRKPQAASTADDADLLARMTALVEELRLLNPPIKPLAEVKPPVEKTEAQKIDNAYQEKVRRISHTYANFFNQKSALFKRECRYIAAVYSDTDQSGSREVQRIHDLPAGPHNAPPMSTELMPTSMPVSFEDHAKVHAALALLKDYYAPESAPFSRATKWHSLRRLFTFHTGRRYCQDAETFYKELHLMPLATPKNIADIHAAVNRKLDELRDLPHDKKAKNDIFNSSYTRRLFYIRETLQTTHAYQAALTDLSKKDAQEAYLSIVDGLNKRGGILRI